MKNKTEPLDVEMFIEYYVHSNTLNDYFYLYLPPYILETMFLVLFQRSTQRWLDIAAVCPAPMIYFAKYYPSNFDASMLYRLPV